MNDTRLQGLGVAGSDAAGRKSPHNHTQTARNLRRSLQNAAAGARLIQAEGLDSKSAGDVAASLADALEELHRLERTLDRRIRREQEQQERPSRSSLDRPSGQPFRTMLRDLRLTSNQVWLTRTNDDYSAKLEAVLTATRRHPLSGN